MKRGTIASLALSAIVWGIVCAASARAQMSPQAMHAHLRLQLQWQRQGQRLVQRQMRQANKLSGPNVAQQIARRQAAEQKRILQLVRKQQQFRLTLLRGIAAADLTAMRRIQRASSGVRPTPPFARPRAPTNLSMNGMQPNRTGRQVSLVPPRAPATSLLDELAPLMFLHAREKPSLPSASGLRVLPRPAPLLVRVPKLPSEAPPASIHKPNVSTSPPAMPQSDPTPALESGNVVMRLVERIAAGEWRKRERKEPSAILPEQIAQAPPRPALTLAHPLPALPPEEAFSPLSSSRPSLVEVVSQAPPLPSFP